MTDNTGKVQAGGISAGGCQHYQIAGCVFTPYLMLKHLNHGIQIFIQVFASPPAEKFLQHGDGDLGKFILTA